MDFFAANKLQKDRLTALLARLSADLWRKDLGGGWTVGTQLCHLAFWDKKTTVRIRLWLDTGRLTAVPDEDNINAINDAARFLCAGIDFENGKRLVTEAADEIDALVASLDAERQRALETTGRERWFKRYFHRQNHLDRIEAALA